MGDGDHAVGPARAGRGRITHPAEIVAAMAQPRNSSRASLPGRPPARAPQRPGRAAATAALLVLGLASCRPGGGPVKVNQGRDARPPVPAPVVVVDTPAPAADTIAAATAAGPQPAAAPPAAREPVGPLERPEPRPGGYVGSKACASCHAEIAETFALHSMGQAMDSMPPERLIEGKLEASFRDREREYAIEVRDGTVFHHERALDVDGRPIYDQSFPVRFACGSGTRGRSYLIDHDGFLFQSPIGWFTAAGRYALSPGYDRDRSLRFERRIGDGCLHCHAGDVEHPPERSDRYSEKVFLEAAIGCERCHGPGAGHVEAMQAVPPGTTVADLKICNPADLDPQRREAVCNQCHLGGEATVPRFGRGFYDFRPGDHLDDTLVVFVQDERARAASGDKPVSQVEQMRQSACWTGTGGTIGCTSCHDPHRKPAAEELDAFYRTKCNACHEEKPCTLPAPQREAPPAAGSCIACHMPSQPLKEVAHTAMTDHRVPRRPEDAAARREPAGTADLVAFDGASERVPPRELDRARAIALASRPAITRSTRAAVEAIRLFVPRGIDVPDTEGVVRALAGDVDALRGLGRLFAQTGRLDAAAACWEEALEAAPNDGETLSLLARQLQRAGRLPEALGVLDRLVESNAWISSDHVQRAALLATLGRTEEALTAVRRGLELDPSNLPARGLHAEILEHTGRPLEAERERETISRLKAAAAAPYRGPAPAAPVAPAADTAPGGAGRPEPAAASAP